MRKLVETKLLDCFNAWNLLEFYVYYMYIYIYIELYKKVIIFVYIDIILYLQKCQKFVY